MSEPYQVFLNPTANLGAAGERWASVEAVLRGRGVAVDVHRVALAELPQAVGECLRAGRTRLVAAGGDGTVRAVAEAMLAVPAEACGAASLGMVALGSSCDLLKPAHPDAWVARTQVALDADQARPREVFRLEHDAGVAHYLMNSSVGMIARGSADFLDPPWWLRALRRVLTMDQVVAVYGVLNALTHRPVAARVVAPGRTEEGRYTGITVLKWPHVAGGVVFRTARTTADGRFDVVCLGAVGALRLDALMKEWAVDGPQDGAEVAFFQAPTLTLEFPRPELVEFDGEVVRTRVARYSIVPGALRFMGRGLG